MTFHPNTLFVLGAGAGMDYRMPLGIDLAKKIQDGAAFRFDFSEIVHGDKELFATIKRVFRTDLDLAIRAAQRISQGI